MNIHVAFSVQEDCLNPMDSYGEICVHCNCCGRFNKKTMFKDRIEVFKEHLKEAEEFNDWIEGFEEIQRANKQKQIEYYKELIKQAEIDDRKLQCQEQE